MKDKPGGTITQLRNGRFWARAPGKPQKSCGTFATYEEAEIRLHAISMLIAKRDEISALHITFGKYGAQMLDQRELDDTIRGIKQERNRWKLHLANCDLTHMALSDIETIHIAELVRTLQRKQAKDKRGKRKISSDTVARCITLVSNVFRSAIQRGIVDRNPCVGIEIDKRTDEDTEDDWTFLTLDEQRRLLACEVIPVVHRMAIAFALFTGIRQGEQHHNFLRDLHVDGADPHLFVRFGSKGRRPKSGKGRKVPLIPQAIDATRQWLELRASFMRKVAGARHDVRKDEGIIFPTITGCRRQSGKTLGNGWKDKQTGHWVDRLKHYYELAGIPDRPGLHWHALRHTCATSLIEGWWDPQGRGWSLEEVKEMLGHSSIAVTERYAHHAGTRLRAAADRMRSVVTPVVTGGGFGVDPIAAISCDSEGVGRAGHDPATYGLKGQAIHKQYPQLVLDSPPLKEGSVTTSLARVLLQLVASGQTQAALAVAVSLAESSVSTADPKLVRSSG